MDTKLSCTKQSPQGKDRQVNTKTKSETTDCDSKKILVMIGTDRLGHGDDTLGKALLVNFLKTLKEMEPDLWRVVLVNNGVKLTVQDADSLPFLQELSDGGVSILACGTCLNHFKLMEQKQVGETTNMLDIVTSMQLADNVITI